MDNYILHIQIQLFSRHMTTSADGPLSCLDVQYIVHCTTGCGGTQKSNIDNVLY
jgi:hypothetical protein